MVIYVNLIIADALAPQDNHATASVMLSHNMTIKQMYLQSHMT